MWIRWVYTVLLAFAAPFLLFSLYKSKPGKPPFGSRWKEHWGLTPKVAGIAPIWIHAVSVGESIAATPLIKALKARNPSQPIVVTTTTSTGAEQIAKLGDLVTHRYMPLDFAWCVRGFLRAVNPSQMLLVETELWPNTIHTVAKADIPITVLNARLSERSCQRYQKFQRVFDLLANNITTILCQFNSDAERFIRLGVAPEKVQVTGSVKFDIQVSEQQIQVGRALRAQLGADRPVWIAASTHRGEDEIVLDAHRQLLKHIPNALLVLVPRHPERFDEVAKLCLSKDFDLARRSEANGSQVNNHVYLGDTMGEMMTLLGAADICFMGGSLLGDKVGGHNPLEPAAFALPILTGPSYFNFEQVFKPMLANQSAAICSDVNSITQALLERVQDPQHARTLGQKAEQILNANAGAIDRTLDHIIGKGHS